MRFLWVCNIELPVISDLLGHKRVSIGGWLDTFSRTIISNENDKLMVVYPNITTYNGFDKNLFYSSFNPKTDLMDYFSNILKTYKPDIIHLWGTEFKFTHSFTEAIKLANLLNFTVISIQGLISKISQHYFSSLPFKVTKPYSFKDRLRNKSLQSEKMSFENRGKFEVLALKNSLNVIGRTDWDKAVVSQINPTIKYHSCNEVMRRSFYLNKWDIKNINKFTIFFPQWSYPYKGFHILIEAFSVVSKKFPDAIIITTGNNFLIKPFYKLTSYEKYLKEIIFFYKLENRIYFLGNLSEYEMMNNLLKCNIFVLPSFIENSSNSLAEAMLLGVPIIASYVGGTPTFINHGKEGYLYPANEPYILADLITKLFLSPKTQELFSKNAINKASKLFDENYNFSNLLSIYNKIIYRNKVDQ